ncbi:hypothetical protein COL21_13480 [Bacillus thuringiensis]|uniref:hypothetical protein n=1 Tax=Bacillus thuringiensis TaxID=1428 RepID=UPI000BF425AD|nr:hypothetical protein [Bacillus thuringiensis]PFV97055.1 hypothetical protein COL21_13480 [Bacillus thuringiensis]PGR90458.1 hypothetical protein COC68_26415 [Bacillus thuringiensis]
MSSISKNNVVHIFVIIEIGFINFLPKEFVFLSFKKVGVTLKVLIFLRVNNLVLSCVCLLARERFTTASMIDELIVNIKMKNGDEAIYIVDVFDACS